MLQNQIVKSTFEVICQKIVSLYTGAIPNEKLKFVEMRIIDKKKKSFAKFHEVKWKNSGGSYTAALFGTMSIFKSIDRNTPVKNF